MRRPSLLTLLMYRLAAWMVAWPVLILRFGLRVVLAVVRILLDPRDRGLSCLWALIVGVLILLWVTGR